MPIRTIAANAHIASRFIRRSALLATVSVSALVVVSPDAMARALNGSSGSPIPAAAVAGQAAQIEASRAARDAQNALQGATRSIQAIQTAQQAARDAARVQPNVTVPNGLAPGGLQVGNGLWQGANLWNAKALVIDATQTTNLSGTAQLSAASLSVSSGRIGLGGGSEGLVLLLPTLQQLANTQHLTLRSYSSIDFHQSMNFGGAGLARVTLDAGALAGYGNSNILVTGDVIGLENSGGGMAVTGTGNGALALTARELILGNRPETRASEDAELNRTASPVIV